MIHIDDTRCIRCGLCARVCALHCFQVTEEGVHIRHEGYCMHCGHCTAAVEKALRALPGVESAVADLEKKEARVKAAAGVSDVMLSAVVTGAGFKVTGIDTL